jgi:hypothetical protein
VDTTPEVKRATTVAPCAGNWLRDEEATGSNPATPTHVTDHCTQSQADGAEPTSA